MKRYRTLLLATLLPFVAALSGDAGTEADYPRVFRTFMPNSGPSAFAVELVPSLALCYDPLRGGVGEIWTGSVDLSPTLRAKINGTAMPRGEIIYLATLGHAFYVPTLVHPLRLGDPAAEPEYRFKGYRYEAGAIVFEFTLRGHPVSETLRADEEGRGLVRELAFPEGGGPAFLRVEKQVAAEVHVEGGAEVEPGLWRFPEGGKATVRILPKTPAAP